MSVRRRKQRGQALLLLAAILALSSAWYMVKRLEEMSANATVSDRTRNAAVLNRAKQALIGYVAAQAAKKFEDNPGALPCPEALGYFDSATQNGQTASSCSLPKIGRFPWRTIGTDKLVDAAGEPLWYVVASGWAYTGSNTVINSNCTSSTSGLTCWSGQLTVNGVANDAVALIIAPGAAFNVAAATGCTAWPQARPTTGNPDWRNYLECYDATNPAVFVTTGPSGSFNDQVIKITAADILPAIEAGIAHRFERDIAPQIRTAFSGGVWAANPVLPFAVSLADPTASPANKFEGESVISIGTAAVTNSSANATLSVAPTVSMAGRVFHLQGATTYYRIATHAANTTAITFDSAYNEATNGAATYQILVPQGLFPGNYSTTGPCTPSPTFCTPAPCTVASDARCDPAFVAWQSAPVITRTGGATPSTISPWYTCSVSGTPTTLTCTMYVVYPIPLVATVNDYMTFALAATASNVGMALRQINGTVPVTGVELSVSPVNSPYGYSASTGVMNSDGSATITINSRVSAGGGTQVTDALCGLSDPDPGNDCYTHTISLPMALLADHPVVDPSNSDYTWFFRNKWHEVAYYAVAPNITPAGTRSCVTSSTCLQVNYHVDVNRQADDGKPRAVLIFGGSKLSGQNRPVAVLTDLLEGANAGGASPFEVRSATLTPNRTFNDRFAVIDSN